MNEVISLRIWSESLKNETKLPLQNSKYLLEVITSNGKIQEYIDLDKFLYYFPGVLCNKTGGYSHIFVRDIGPVPIKETYKFFDKNGLLLKGVFYITSL